MTTTIEPPRTASPAPEPANLVTRLVLRFGSMFKTLIPTHQMVIQFEDGMTVTTHLESNRKAELTCEPASRVHVTVGRHWMQYDLAEACLAFVRPYVRRDGLWDEWLLVDVTEWIESPESDACLMLRDATLKDDIEISVALKPHFGLLAMKTPEGRWIAQYHVNAKEL